MSEDNSDSDNRWEFRAAVMVVSPGESSRTHSSAGVDITPSKKGFVLSRAARKRLKDRQVRELLEVFQFYCLGFGCQQVRKEHYLSTRDRKKLALQVRVRRKKFKKVQEFKLEKKTAKKVQKLEFK